MPEYVEREITCFDDCFHNPICILRIKGDEWKRCVHFKNKADVVEVRHGKWCFRKTWDLFVCSECSFENTNCSHYCPKCGAKMDGKGEGE